jgi:hypothetical protein
VGPGANRIATACTRCCRHAFSRIPPPLRQRGAAGTFDENDDGELSVLPCRWPNRTWTYMLSNSQTGLTPEKLQLFIAGLSGLNADEVRKAKILFVRNELSQLKALKAAMAGFGVAQGSRLLRTLQKDHPCFLADPVGTTERDECGGDTTERSASQCLIGMARRSGRRGRVDKSNPKLTHCEQSLDRLT